MSVKFAHRLAKGLNPFYRVQADSDDEEEKQLLDMPAPTWMPHRADPEESDSATSADETDADDWDRASDDAPPVPLSEDGPYAVAIPVLPADPRPPLARPLVGGVVPSLPRAPGLRSRSRVRSLLIRPLPAVRLRTLRVSRYVQVLSGRGDTKKMKTLVAIHKHRRALAGARYVRKSARKQRQYLCEWLDGTRTWERACQIQRGAKSVVAAYLRSCRTMPWSVKTA